MRAGCKCHSNIINNSEGHYDHHGISRLRRIASALGINLAEIDICHTNLAELISIAQRRAHQKPFLWAHLKAIYGNVNVLPALSKLATSGISSHINKIIAMVNNGASSNTIDAYINELIENQAPKKIKHFNTIA